MGNKRVVILLAILTTLCLCLGIAGFLNRDYEPVEIEPEISNKIKVQEIAEETMSVDDLYSIVGNAEFVKANTEYLGENISVEVTGSGVIVKVNNDILNIEDQTDEEGNVINTTSFSITDVNDVVAAQATVSTLEGNRVNVYMLDKDNYFYQAVFYADPENNNEVATYKYNITNAESFTILNVAFTEDATEDLKYVVVKTEDGSYYTDYPFEETFTVRRIEDKSGVNDEPTPEVVEDENNTDDQTDTEE